MKRIILLSTLLALLVQTGVRADVILKQKQHSDEFTMMGKTQPAKDVDITTTIAEDKVRSDRDETSVILRADKKLILFLNHKQNTYAEMPMEPVKSAPAAEGEGGADEGMAAMQKMMKGMGMNISMKMKMTVTPTGETKKINSWNCKKYLQTLETGGMKMETVVWASEDVKIDPELNAKLSTAMLAMMPGFKDAMEDLNKEARKIKGVAVRSETSTTMMGNVMKSSSELVEVKETKAPAGIFDPPAGYKQEKIEKIMGGRR
jgi:hypothetical protein